MCQLLFAKDGNRVVSYVKTLSLTRVSFDFQYRTVCSQPIKVFTLWMY